MTYPPSLHPTPAVVCANCGPLRCLLCFPRPPPLPVKTNSKPRKKARSGKIPEFPESEERDLVPPPPGGARVAVRGSDAKRRERCGRFPAPEEDQVDLNWR